MNSVDHLQEDAAARQRALDLASFIVEAPAGAGKTELLTQRYLRLLAAVEQPEEVLALTFTNKAAAEMRDRILGSLEMAAAGVEPSLPHKRQTFVLASRALARDTARGWHLLAHPGRLRITTLDALCASLARQMPYLSRFGGQPAVADDAGAHYASAARCTLAMVEGGDADAETVAAALAFMDNHAGRLESLLVAMLGRRDQWLQHTGRLASEELRAEVEAGFQALVERDLAAVGELLDSRWQERLMPLARFAAAHAPDERLAALHDWTMPLPAEAADLPRWQALADLLLTLDGNLRKVLDKRVGFPAGKEFAAQKEAMAEILADLAALPGIEARLAVLGQLPQPRLSDEEWATVEHFARLLRLAAAQLWLVFQEAGEVDFIEIAARAKLALGDEEAPTDLAQALDYRIRHLLVDEFQDTSPSQVKLIASLTRGWMPDDGRTLFVVGDPMQSIYRFRKADVGLFLRVRAGGIGDIRLEHLRLFRNNRSCPAIVDWVNAVFPAIFPAADAPETGAVRYAPATATRPEEAGSGAFIHALIADADPAAAEARRVLDIIRATRLKAPDERIAVLVRARGHLDALVGEIRRSAPELAFQAVDIEGLDGRQHVQDLLTLFRALHHRADRVHWLALLRAPWCGLTMADLHALAGDDHRRHTIWQLMQDEARLDRLTPDGQTRLRHVRDALRLVFAQRDRQHPRRWLEAAWLLLGGPRCLEAPAALADVEAFFALLDRLAAAGKLDAETLAARAGELFAPADPHGGAVQMMTIHKAKGLEFDTVILLGLHRDVGGNESSLLLWDEVVAPAGGARLLVAPLKPRGGSGEASAYDYLRRLENERAAHEDERLLYVAATRAIRRLHLVGVAAADERKEDGLKPPPAGSLLRLLWADVAQPVFVEALGTDAPLPPRAALSPDLSPRGREAASASPLHKWRGAGGEDRGAGGEGEVARETAAGSSIALACAAALHPGPLPASRGEGERGVAGNAPFFDEPPPLPNPSPARGEGLYQTPAAPPDSASFVPPLLRLAVLEVPVELRAPPVADESQPRQSEAQSTASSEEAALGRLVHRALELIARDGLPQWPAERVDALAPAWRRWLQAEGLTSEAAAEAAAEAIAAVRRTLASATGRWLLAGHAGAGVEEAWSSRDDQGGIAHHIIDRCFVADGCRWIIDYKTVHLPEAELATRAAQYRPQLERYAALFTGEGLPLRLAIYFPLQDSLVALE